MSDSTKQSRTQRPDIAVVGAGALFPGSLDGKGFWKDILAGTDLITDVPASHWLIEDYYDPDPSVTDKTYAKRGAFLGDVDFDAMGWGIPPTIIPETDTSQLLALIVAQKVLEDAATGPLEEMDRSRISVILGVTSGQELLGSMVSRLQRPVWAKSLREAGLAENEVGDICERIASHYTPWRESTFPGLLGNVVAGRIANRLNLGGTNCVTDAACASTLSSLSMAVNELYLGDSDMVITGGVDTMNDIFMFMCFSKTPALSPSGDCRPFSDKADGTMLGEGLGMVALKRLEDAERDGNRIYAVIKSVGSSSDGRSKSVYAPVPEGQARCLRRAYELAGYGPETVELVEAHGTGTVAGDAAEFEGLATVFNESGREDRQWCALGSVKSQIGHTKAAAGAAGLFKAVMALHHRVLPPIIKIDRPNPALVLEQSPFHLPSHARPWVRGSSHPRRASVSSFGFGGSNFHIAMEEYVPHDGAQHPVAARAPRLRTFGHELVILQGGSGSDVAAQARSLAASCGKSGALAWLAHDSQRRYRADSAARLAIVASDGADLALKLEQAAQRLERDGETPFSTPTGLYFGTAAREGRVAFLFSGQGSQYTDMGASVAMHFDKALAVWDAAADLNWEGGVQLHDVVFPRTAYDDDTRAAQARLLTATEWAQPAIGCMSLSLLALLDDLGLKADCHGGHSFGEVMALTAAGGLSAADVVRVARRRGELMRDAARTPGSMVAVPLSVGQMKDKLDGWGIDVVIANHNGPGQVVLSGTTADIEAVEAKLKEEGMHTHRLGVATAFHSPVVAEAAHAFRAWLGDVPFYAPNCPVYSNSTAQPHPDDASTIRESLGEQLARPVLFMEMIEAMYESGVRTFVEVGPGSILTGLTSGILEGRSHAAVSLDRKGVDGLRGLLQGLGALVAGGHALDFASLLSGYATPVNPDDLVQPKLVLPLNGSNYGKPYPPQGGHVNLPAPNPVRVSIPESALTQSIAPLPPQLAAARPASSATPTAALAPTAAPILATTAAPIPAPTATPILAPTAAPILAPARAVTVNRAPSSVAAAPRVALGSNWAQAFESAQRQTADAHAAYIQAMARSHQFFLETVGHGFDALSAGVSGRTGADTGLGQRPAPIYPIAAPTALKPSVPSTASHVPSHPAQPIAPMIEPAIKPAIAPVIEPVREPVREPVIDAARCTTAATPTAATLDLQALMLDIVAEKTGYPTEMLTMEMELEGDLGIDSIKRVEILAAMQERAPGLPEVEVRVMAKLRTLGQIVDYMNGEIAKVTGDTAPSATTAIAAPTAPTLDLQALMLDIVAEKTGYPTEMLTMEMELEGDLGIDSIKRVEILAAMQERAPGLPEVEVRVMAKLRTLGQIVDYMNGEIAKVTGDTAPSATTAIAASTAHGTSRPASPELGRFVLEAVESTAIGMSERGIRGQGRVVVTDDGNGLARCVVEELASRGIAAEVASAIPEAGLRGVIFLGGLREVGDDEAAIAVNREAFATAKAAAAAFADGGNDAKPREGFFLVVQDTGGSFGTSGIDPRRAWMAGCAGLARTLAQEWPGVAIKAVDLERGRRSASQLANALVDELLGGGPDVDVGLPADGRRVVLRSVERPVVVASPRLADGDVVVASGGARGVTAATLVALAATARLRFVLLGRTEEIAEPDECAGLDDPAALKRALLARAKSSGVSLAPAQLGRQVSDILARREIRSTLEALANAGSEARYFATDATEPAAVAATLDEVRKTWGPVAAVVHGAGVIQDRLVAEKTVEQFDRVFDTKVRGLRALLGATAGDPLKVLCLFSSVAARCGNLGQSDYAMANEVLNKVAVAEAARRGDSCLVRSMGWGPWAGGMVSADLQARFEALGVPLIDLVSGAKMFVDELAGAPDAGCVELVLGGRPRPEALLPSPDGRSLSLDVTIDRDSHPYLSDHSIRETPVVPVALAIEWFGRAARAFAPEMSVAALRDVRVLRGIPLKDFDSGRLHLVVRCRQASVGDDRSLALELCESTGAALYRCTADMVQVRAAHQGFTNGRSHYLRDLKLEAWGDRLVYDGEVLFHGPKFQMIRSIDGVSDHGIAAHLDGVADLDWHLGGDDDDVAGATRHGERAGWRTDPAAIDGGLQLALLWCKHRLGGASLPTGIAAVRTWTDGAASGPIHCTVIGRDSRGSRSVSDMVLRDGQGHVFAELEGVETHLVPQADDSRA